MSSSLTRDETDGVDAVPTLGSAAAFLRSTATMLSARLGDVARVAQKTQNFDAGDVDEMDQVSATDHSFSYSD